MRPSTSRVATLGVVAAAGLGGLLYLKQSGLSVETLVQVRARRARPPPGPPAPLLPACSARVTADVLLAPDLAAANAQELQDLLASQSGPQGPAIFIGAYALATVMLVPASLLTLAAGYLYGAPPGTRPTCPAALPGACLALAGAAPEAPARRAAAAAAGAKPAQSVTRLLRAACRAAAGHRGGVRRLHAGRHAGVPRVALRGAAARRGQARG
jgi:hypothetical protein